LFQLSNLKDSISRLKEKTGRAPKLSLITVGEDRATQTFALPFLLFSSFSSIIVIDESADQSNISSKE